MAEWWSRRHSSIVAIPKVIIIHSNNKWSLNTYQWFWFLINSHNSHHNNQCQERVTPSQAWPDLRPFTEYGDETGDGSQRITAEGRHGDRWSAPPCGSMDKKSERRMVCVTLYKFHLVPVTRTHFILEISVNIKITCLNSFDVAIVT